MWDPKLARRSRQLTARQTILNDSTFNTWKEIEQKCQNRGAWHAHTKYVEKTISKDSVDRRTASHRAGHTPASSTTPARHEGQRELHDAIKAAQKRSNDEVITAYATLLDADPAKAWKRLEVFTKKWAPRSRLTCAVAKAHFSRLLNPGTSPPDVAFPQQQPTAPYRTDPFDLEELRKCLHDLKSVGHALRHQQETPQPLHHLLMWEPPLQRRSARHTTRETILDDSTYNTWHDIERRCAHRDAWHAHTKVVERSINASSVDRRTRSSRHTSPARAPPRQQDEQPTTTQTQLPTRDPPRRSERLRQKREGNTTTLRS